MTGVQTCALPISVVENPEHDSKKASMGEGIAPEIKKGMAPIKAEMNQYVVTMKKPSRTFRSWSRYFVSLAKNAPTMIVIKIVMAKASATAVSP